MSLVHFYVFRHGETDWNVEKRFQGHTDIPLNIKGKQEATLLAQKLKALDLNAIASSDLSRAHETALIANKELNLPLVTTPHLRELSFGSLEGKLRDDVHVEYGEEHMRLWYSTDLSTHHMRFPGGESKAEALARLQGFLKEFALTQPQWSRVGVSTHGGALRRIVHACEGAPQEPVPIPNTCLYKVLYDRKIDRWIFAND